MNENKSSINDNNNKGFFKSLFAFLTSKIFLNNLAAMLGTVLGILLLAFWWMRCYTQHGDSLPVPDFVNQDMEKAEKLARKNDLHLVINDSIWTATQPAGIVLSQSPEPNALVKENRTIYISVSKSQGETKTLPSLAGNDNYSYYARRLKQMKVNLEITDRQFNSKLEENTILYLMVDGKKITEQELKEGVSVPQGASVQAVVTTRGAGEVKIPDLVCKKYDEAAFVVTGFKLAVGSVIKDGTVTNESDAYVWKQNPPFDENKTLEVGQPVDLYLTRRLPADCQ